MSSTDHPAMSEVGPPPGAPEQVLTVDTTSVRAVADLLELLGELPSTPERLASVSRARAGDTARLLPVGGQAGHGHGHGHGSVELGVSLLVSAAGLLQRLGELPSTPPVVAEDARSWAAQLWERLEAPEQPAGHRHDD